VLPLYRSALEQLEAERIAQLAKEERTLATVRANRPFGPEDRQTYELRQRLHQTIVTLGHVPTYAPQPLTAQVSWGNSVGLRASCAAEAALKGWFVRWRLDFPFVGMAVTKTLENWLKDYDPMPGHLAPFGWNFLSQSGPAFGGDSPKLASPFKGAPPLPRVSEYRPTFEAGWAVESPLDEGARGAIKALNAIGFREQRQTWLEREMESLGAYLAPLTGGSRLTRSAAKTWLRKQRAKLIKYQAAVYRAGEKSGLITVPTPEGKRLGWRDHVEWVFRQRVLEQKDVEIAASVPCAEVTVKKGLKHAREMLHLRAMQRRG
jgi:hypothetical protein